MRLVGTLLIQTLADDKHRSGLPVCPSVSLTQMVTHIVPGDEGGESDSSQALAGSH